MLHGQGMHRPSQRARPAERPDPARIAGYGEVAAQVEARRLRRRDDRTATEEEREKQGPPFTS